MKQAAGLVAVDRDVAVLVRDDGEFGEHGIAVVAVRIDGIAPVGELGPERIGEILVVRGLRPARHRSRLAGMGSLHFLQEDQIGADRPNRLAQLQEHEATAEKGEALVSVDA